MNRRVVVTGTGIITALGSGIKKNREMIFAGVSGIDDITCFDAKKFRASRGGEAKGFSEASLCHLDGRRLDRASHLVIEATREALSDAGISDTIMESPVFLSLGTTLGGMISGEEFHQRILNKGLQKSRLSLPSDYLAHYQGVNLFKEFGFKGDFRVVSNACASGTAAIGYAFQSLRSGEYDVAVSGGYDTMSEFVFAGFNSLMAVSPGLCRPFDKNRDGLVIGEGTGILILEVLERAIKRGANILGEVVGYGESSDSYHMTSADPLGSGAASAIIKALEDAGRPSIDYINAHGTGTPLNDAMESRAIALAFGEKKEEIPVSSIKPLIGHLLGAAGAVEAIVSLLSIAHKSIPPNINFETPDPECGLNIVSEPGIKCDIRSVLSNSFGFGGSNASIIFKEFQ